MSHAGAQVLPTRPYRFCGEKNMLPALSSLSCTFSSRSQRIRVLSEAWAAEHLFCPQCGGGLSRFPNNSPVADFFCAKCKEEYELKSSSSIRCARIPGGAYQAMIRRLLDDNNPNFIMLRYDKASLAVREVFVVPRYYFVPGLIRKRAPLAATARRAGWVGCTIELDKVPQAGRIALVAGGKTRSKADVRNAWLATGKVRLGQEKGRGWLLAVVRCIESLHSMEFCLADLYAQEERFKRLHPENRNIKAKLRQQLQILRNQGCLQFIGPGRYRLSAPEGAGILGRLAPQ